MSPARPLAFALLALAACSTPPDVCAPGQDPHPAALDATRPGGLHAHTHAHNDYLHDHPLADALAAKFYSVEADVYFAGGEFQVSHLGLQSVGTLEALYLEPLKARVAEKGGSVHGDGVPFFLVIDLKDDHPQLAVKLEALLANYPMFTSWEGNTEKTGPIRVILTGNAGAKERYVEAISPRHATRDSNDFSPSDAPNVAGWTDYALDWGTYLDWDGTGEMPAEQQKRLGCILETAHRLERRVRFYGIPDRKEAWGALVTHGGDFVQTDDLPGLSAFLDAQD